MRPIIAALSALVFVLASAAAHSAPLSKPVTSILVEKSKRQMTLYHKGKALKSYRVALGGNPVGHKQQEGDSRTPEGQYTIDSKNPNSSFHLSLHVSYPNKADRAAAKLKGVSPGGLIMIHGMPEGLAILNAFGFYPDWTAGCIAITNPEIEEVFSSVKIGTPITIVP